MVRRDAHEQLEFLIVADHDEPAGQLAQMLRRSPTRGARQRSPLISIAPSAGRTLSVGNADVVFVDANEPNGQWRETIRQLAAIAPATPIIALVPPENAALCKEALAAGASECLKLDQLDADRLNAAVQSAVAAGQEHQAVLLDALEHVGEMGAWTYDPQTQHAEWSRGLYRLFGLEPRQNPPSFEEFLALVHPDDRQKVIDANRTLNERRNGNPVTVKYRLVPGNGSVHWFEATSRVESYLPSGDPARLVGVVKDISARELAEATLRESEELFRNAIAHAQVGIGIIGLNGRWMRVNRALYEMLGYSETELLQKAPSDIVHPGDVVDDRANLQRLFDGHASMSEAEVRFIHKDGHTVLGLVTRTAVRDGNGYLRHVISQVQDITERRRIRDSLEFTAEASRVLASSLDSEEILRTIAHLAVPRLADWCVIDLLDDSTDTLRTVEVVAVVAEKEDILRDIRRRYPLAPFSFDHPVSRVIRTGQSTLMSSSSGEALRRAARDEQHRELIRRLAVVSSMIVPLAARGRIIGAITFATSESARKFNLADLRLAEELATSAALAIDNARLYDDAKGATSLRDDVLGFVAHDLRNPLSAISRWATRLDEPNTTAAERHRASSAISEAADVMNRLIADLLDITRLESGHLRVEQEPVPVPYLLSTAREMFEPIARKRSIALVVEADEGPRVHADPQRVHQVLSNLIGNALRLIPDGGKITVRSESRANEIEISVTDTGPGIAPADIPHVFDRFWQAAHARKTGVGLGLAIARGIVEAHGGRIWVESELGNGATFHFTLPAWHGMVQELEPRHPRTGAPVTAQAEQVLRVMVVDDHPMTRSGLVQVLERHQGISVVAQASTGEEAVELAPRARPDVIIMDLSMPGIGGVEATRRIVAESDDAIVLVLTADEAPNTLADALRAGARGYLRKTVNEDELIDALRAIARGEVLIDPALKDFLRAGLGVSADRETPPALKQLSERERKVLALSAQGYTAAQTAEKLFLSPKTVETYRARAMRKLGLDTRADLVAFAMRYGLLSS
jgi:PAS domain S-box-containing protein